MTLWGSYNSDGEPAIARVHGLRSEAIPGDGLDRGVCGNL